MKLTILLILLCLSSLSYGIELIINGKSYHIESYQIENNGQRIVIPDKPIRERKPASSFGSLLQDLEGGFKDIEDSLEKTNTRKENFR